MRALIPVVMLALAALMVLGVVPAASAATVTTTVGNVIYEADNLDVPAGATATGYVGPGASSVTIPYSVMIGGTAYTVTSIGADAFDHSDLVSVTLPDGVKSVGDRAFSDNRITSLTLGAGLTTIGVSAFEQNNVASVTIPDGVTSIGTLAFRDSEVASLTLGSGLTTIGSYAFTGNFLASVTIPDGVTTIGDRAFQFNPLTSLSLGAGLTTIGSYAFFAGNLVSVTIPAGVTSIGDGAFYLNPWLTDALFRGAAPASIGVQILGSGDPLVSFYWAFGDPQTVGGFTSPTWQSYDSQAIAVVDFDLGGFGSPVPAEEVIVGDTVAAPTTPTANGRTFAGWFTSATGGTQWDFTADAVTGDRTLYAQWAELAATGTEVAPAVATAILAMLLGSGLLLWRRRRRLPVS